MNLPPLVRLLRPALAPTAAADILAGAAVVGGAKPLPLACAVAASVCLYTAGMGQNDLCDRARDARLHPNRPLVVDPSLSWRARVLVTALFGAGLLLAGLAGGILPALVVVVLASSYNLGVKNLFPGDVLALGGARGANLALGMAVCGGFNWTFLGCYALFIAGITGGSRAEDMEPSQTRRLVLLLAFLPTLAACGILAWLSAGAPVWLLALPALAQAVALRRAVADGTRGAAKRYTLRSLLTIFVLHGALLYKLDKGLVGILVCAGMSYLLLAAFAPARPEEVT